MSIFILSDPPFNWCHLKLARAREHMHILNNEITAWIKTDPGCIVNEHNAEATRYSVIVRVTNPPKLERWAMIAADCFHNFRAVLDQFLYAVAVFQSKTDPPPNVKLLQFPLCDTQAAFADNREQRRIQSLSISVRTAIERVQPYHRRHPELPPLLSLLRDFDNADKHRLPHLTMIRQIEGTFEKLSGIAIGQPVEVIVNADSVNDGAEIAALVLDRPTPNVHYQAFRAKLRVAVNHAPGPQGHARTGLQGLINIISAEVDEVMLEIYKAL
jgi:hypothetical protein